MRKCEYEKVVFYRLIIILTFLILEIDRKVTILLTSENQVACPVLESGQLDGELINLIGF